MCITALCDDPTDAGIWWREDDKWVRYNIEQALGIVMAKFRNESSLELRGVKSEAHPSGAKYVIDLNRMKQVNTRTGHTRRVKFVKLDNFIRNVEQAYVNLTTHTSSTSSKALVELVKALCDENFVEEVIKKKYPGVKSVRKNPYLEPTTHEPFQEFMKTFSQALNSNTEITGEIIKAVKNHNLEDLKSIEYVFHGTPKCNQDSILMNGLDPSLSKDERIWVGLEPAVSKHYSRDSNTLIMFLEVYATDSSSNYGQRRSLPASQRAYLLPIAEVDV